MNKGPSENKGEETLQQGLLEEVQRIAGHPQQNSLQSSQYEEWDVQVTDGMGIEDGWKIDLEGPVNSFQVLVDNRGKILGALGGKNGGRPGKIDLPLPNLLRILSSFQEKKD